MWKRRLESQAKVMRRDLSRLESITAGKTLKASIMNKLETKYKLEAKGLHIVKEELKQRIVAKAGKIKRYSDRIEQYRQNRLFSYDQSRFYSDLDKARDDEQTPPNREECKEFWSGIWSDTTEHKKDAEWLKDMKSEANTRKQENLKIDIDKLRAVLKMSSWKAPGPGLVQGFWLKNMTNMHARLVDQLNACLTTGEVPQWLTKGRTLLFVKDQT